MPILLCAADSSLRLNKIFGGSGFENVTAITTDRFGFVIAGGVTSSYDFPVTDGSRNTATHFASSSDAGGSWSPLGNLPAGMPLSLTLDTSTPPVWYAAGNKGLFKSTDEGATWTETGPHGLPNCDPGCVAGIAIDPTQPSIIYARASGGILKSTDGGATWLRLPQPIDNPNAPAYLVLDPFQPGHLFTSGGAHNYQSFDGGLTWTEISELAPHPGDFCGSGVAPDAVTPGLVYLSDHCDLFRSTDGGVSWQVLTTPFPRSPATAVAHPTRAGGLYVLTPSGLYFSGDAGDSWTLLLPYENGNGLAVDPAHPDTILTTDARSHDSGATWQPLGLGLNVGSIVFDPEHPGRAIVSTSGASAAFLVKLDSAGDVRAATLFGGQGGAFIAGVATDPDGNVYVTGGTRSFDFPITSGAWQTTMPTSSANAFAAKFDPDLKLVYATFVPGISQVTSIAVDLAGSAAVLGWNPPSGQCEVTKLTPDGAGAVFVAQLGSNSFCRAVTSDMERNTIVAGSNGDSFVTKFDPAGNMIFTTTLGGSKLDDARSIAADRFGNIHVAGNTQSTDFPTTGNVYQTAAGSRCSYLSGFGGFFSGVVPFNQSMFVAKLDPGGNPIYSTYFGTGCDTAHQVALDAAGNVWIAGQTNSPQFPQVMAFESGPPLGNAKGVVSMLNSNASAIGFSSYLSGANVITVDPFGAVYVGGSAGGHASVAKIQTQYPALLAIRAVGNAFGRRNGPVSPGQITLITADRLAPDPPRDLTLTPSDPLPRTLSGIQVLFDGEPAALVSVLPGQAVAVAPYDLAGHRQTTVQIAANGVLSTPLLADVLADRAYLTADDSGAGRAFARNPDGSVNSPDNPAPQGSYVTIYATGIGAAGPGCAEGTVATTAEEPAPNGGYTSIPGYLCGIFQISFRAPFTAGNVGIGDSGLTVAVK